MARLKIFPFLVFFIVTINLKAQFKAGPNGVKYFFWRSTGSIPRAQIGDLVFVEMVGKTEKDSIVMSSYVQGHQFQIFVPKPTYKGCFYEMLTILGENDSAEVSVVADSFFLKSMGSKMPDFVRKGSKLRLTIRMVSIVTRKEYDERVAEEAKQAPEIQASMIENFISKNQMQMTKTESGMYYQFPLKGISRRVKKGDSVLVNFTGYFLDEKVFDSSIPDNKPIGIKVGSPAVLKGWNEALQLMSVGDKILIIVPYQLAYGEKGYGVIPAHTPLLYEIELLDIK